MTAVLTLVFCFVVVLGSAAITWVKDAKDGVNQGKK